jgi:hypothetical protein
VTDYYPYPYGIKSQVVPFYQWELANTTKLFGTELNNWATDTSDIVQGKQYQSLDRTKVPYFQSDTAPTNNDTYKRGYIFSVNSNEDYSVFPTSPTSFSPKFLVGAPFHFYFGVIKGESALDKFKTKYSIGE